MENDLQFFSVVVIGHMNPLIHHPSWYGQFQLLTDEEVKEAVERNSGSAISLSMSPDRTAFHCGGFQVLCEKTAWGIHCSDPTLRQRALKMGARVFDLLYHTPVEGYAFTSVFHRATNLKHVGRRIAEMLDQSPLGLQWAESPGATATCQFDETSETYERSVAIEQSSRSPESIFVGFRTMYSAPKVSGPFDLTPLLERGMVDHDHAVGARLEKILSLFSDPQEGD